MVGVIGDQSLSRCKLLGDLATVRYLKKGECNLNQGKEGSFVGHVATATKLMRFSQ